MHGASFSYPARSRPVLFWDRVYLSERPCSPIHCPRCVRPLSWIMRERCWCLSTIHRTRVPNCCLLTWRGSHSRWGLIGPCGFFVGVLTWRRRGAGIGCGGRSLTFAVLFWRWCLRFPSSLGEWWWSVCQGPICSPRSWPPVWHCMLPSSEEPIVDLVTFILIIDTLYVFNETI